jgi:MoaA/NifB/PqqE/SkfB family radical SAM enzyme
MKAISLKWDITGRCNLKCLHCLQGDRLKEGVSTSNGFSCSDCELDEKHLIHMIDKLPASEIAHINFLGGEPTLLGNKFLRIVKHCSSKGCIAPGPLDTSLSYATKRSSSQS